MLYFSATKQPNSMAYFMMTKINGKPYPAHTYRALIREHSPGENRT